MIKLIVNGKQKYCSNKKGIAFLRKNNPTERFKIALCRATGKKVVMLYDENENGKTNGHKNWLCLHDITLPDYPLTR